MRNGSIFLTLETLSEEMLAPEIEGEAKGYLYLLSMGEDRARDFFENARWPRGPVCIRCRSKDISSERTRSPRVGFHECRRCAHRFSVRTGTPIEEVRAPLRTCLLGIFLLCCTTRRISAMELSRILGLHYDTARCLVTQVGAVMGFDQVLRCSSNDGNIERAVVKVVKI